MFLRKLYPYTLFLCFTVGLCSMTAFAQDSRPRQIVANQRTNEAIGRGDDPVIVSLATDETVNAAPEIKPGKSLITSASGSGLPRLQQMISAAIDERLGSHYRWGATGPTVFDCSGFVWATYHSIGIDFERGSARTLWARFEAPPVEDQYKFGTLVSSAARPMWASLQTSTVSITLRGITVWSMLLSMNTGSSASTDFVACP